MRTGSLLLAGLAAAAIGGAGWLVLGGAGGAGGGDEGDLAEHAATEDARHGPVLTGREAVRAAAPAETVDGEFTIPGKVLDEKGKPVADVPVTARRTGEAYREGDPQRWSWSGAAVFTKSFEEHGVVKAEEKPGATTKSAADGTFALVVKRRGNYTVKAEPEAPRVGTRGEWYLNDKPPTVPLTLRVLSGSTIRGRVVDAQDRGVDAAVSASWSDDTLGTWSPPTVKTGDKGAFAFSVPNGKVNISLSLPGKMSLWGKTVTAPTDEEVLIRIGDFAPLLKGRTKDLQGQPVANARVVVRVNAATDEATKGDAKADPKSETYGVSYFATAGPDGAYTVSGPLGGAVSQVEASAPGYLYASNTPPLAPWSGLELVVGKEAVLDLLLLKGGVVEGRVAEKGTGAALPGVEIQVSPSALDARITRTNALTATTDAQGRYRLDGVPLGRSILMTRHETHYLPALEALAARTSANQIAYQWDAAPPAPPADLVVFIEQEGQRIVKDLEMSKGIPVSGRVVDPGGAPVEGAEVNAQGVGLGNLGWQWGVNPSLDGKPLATSGADGKFTVPGLPPRKDWVLIAKKKPMYGEGCPPFAVAAEGPAPDVVLKLLQGCVLAGRVVDERGNPVANAQVNAWTQQTGGTYQNETAKTGEDGTFRIEGLAAGSVGMNAWAQGRQGTHQQLEALAAGEVREGLELKLTSGVELSGIATDENGAPARQKSLMAQSMQTGGNSMTTTGADGSFKFSDVQPGQVRISAGNWENNVELQVVTAPATGLRLTWKEPPQQVIEGTILDAQGKPVPVCQVAIRAKGTQGQDQRFYYGGGGQGNTVVNGWFRRNATGKPPFTVEVSGPQDARGVPMNLRGKTVNDVDPKAGPITITLEPGIVLAGQVVDPGGKGVENVNVSVGNVRAVTDAQGGFSLGGLAEGEVQVAVQPPAPWVKPQPVPATAGATDMVVRLRTGLPIAGQVRVPTGKSTPQGWVNVSWKATPLSPEGNVGAQVKPDGKFRVEGVPEEATASVNVQFWSMDGQQSFQPQTKSPVRPGTDDLVFDLAGGCEVDGFVVDAQGKALTQGWVMVTTGPAEAENTNYVQIQSDGTFKVSGLQPGPVKLSVYRQDGGPAPEPLRVDAPASRVKVVMPAATPIRGTLVGAGATVWRITAWTVGENRRSVRGSVGADGKFSLDATSAGAQWMIGVRSRNNDDDRYALGGPYAAGTENISLELRLGRSIEGTVVTPDGTDVPGGTWVSVSNDTWNASGQVGAKGEFRVRGLPHGRYKVTSGTQNNMTASQEDVDDGASGIRLTLRASTDE